MQSLEPWGVILGLLGQMTPTLAGQRPIHGARLGVGRRVQRGFVHVPFGVVGMLPGLDPYHPESSGGMEVEVDLAQLFDTEGGERHRPVGVVGKPRFVGAELSDDPPLRTPEEGAE